MWRTCVPRPGRARAQYETYFRPRPRIRRFFGGFELLPPGLTDVQAWRQDATAPTRLRIAGAVGRKP